MPDFFYEGTTKEGEKVKGELFAENETDLRVKLRSLRIRPVKIKERPKSPGKQLVSGKDPQKGFTNSERLFFVKELLIMFKAKLSIIQALNVLISEGTSLNIRNLASSVKNYMESGMTFSQSLSRFPYYFDNLFLNIVASGELRGNLESVIENWLEYHQKETDLNKSALRTIIYPFIIVTIFFAAFIVVTVGIVPVFEHIYRTYNQPLPLTLLTLITLGSIIKENLVSLLVILSGFSAVFYILYKGRFLKSFFDKIVLQVPFVSSYYKQIYTLRTLYVISLSLKTGLSLTRALELASEKINNIVFESVILDAKEAASKNEPITPFLMQSKMFKPMLIEVIGIGEIMGSVQDMLDEILPYLQDEFKRLSSFLSSVIEPVTLILGGIVIGTILTSFFMPLFTIIRSINQGL